MSCDFKRDGASKERNFNSLSTRQRYLNEVIVQSNRNRVQTSEHNWGFAQWLDFIYKICPVTKDLQNIATN
jgi:hypothetical protein